MSLAQPPIQDRRQAPGMTINLASNNPFRRAASPPETLPNTSFPALSPPLLAPRRPNTSSENERPSSSTNPFLDNYQPPQRADMSTVHPGSSKADWSSLNQRQPQAGNGRAAEALNGLVLGERRPLQQRELENRRPPRPQPRGETLPPRPDRAVRPERPDKVERPDRPERREKPERERARPERPERPERRERPERPERPDKPQLTDVKQDADRKENRRPRRNSDTSVVDSQERHRKDSSRRKPKPNRQVDLIDKLDVTGLYGVGLFHHDGPFDACNPHRNRKGTRAAPMQAFAEGSLNNAIGGSGPVNKDLDFDRIHGRGEDPFEDYSRKATVAKSKQRPFMTGIGAPSVQIDDPKGLVMLHGEETAGLGTSTFFEGTVAPKAAAAQQESEVAGGLQRKKSIVQRIRGKRPEYHARENSREGQAPRDYDDFVPPGPISPIKAQSAGGHEKMYNAKPFFDLGEDEVADASLSRPVTRARTASSPPRRAPGISRTVSNDVTFADDAKGPSSGSGLLSRVKSLKGRRGAAKASG